MFKYENELGQMIEIDAPHQSVLMGVVRFLENTGDDITTTNSQILQLSKLKDHESSDVGVMMANLRKAKLLNYEHIVTGRKARGSGRYWVEMLGEFKGVNNKQIDFAIPDPDPVVMDESWEDTLLERFRCDPNEWPNAGQQDFLQAFHEAMLTDERGQVLFLTGHGGTGKSFCIDRLRSYVVPMEEAKIAITATTGIAAKRIRGVTIHSFLGLGAEFNDSAEDKADAIQFNRQSILLDTGYELIVVVDEISMAGSKLWELIQQIPYKILVIAGDPNQLPPVRDRKIDYYQYPTYALTQQMRTKNGNTYKLIDDFRAAKEAGTEIDIFSYVDGDSVQHISPDDLKRHFHANPDPDKKVASYTNRLAQEVIDHIEPEDDIYQLHGPITVWDGENNIVLAVNGEELEVDCQLSSWGQAQRRYQSLYGEKCNHYTKWNVDFNVPFAYVAFKDIPTHFVKVCTDIDAYEEEEERLFLITIRLRNELKERWGDNWRDHKTYDYREAVKEYMQFKNGLVCCRHYISATSHKLQGASVSTIYVMVDEVQRSKELMYVALSRAINKIVLVK